MSSVKGSALTFVLVLGINAGGAHAQSKSVVIMLSPPQLAGASFLFDDCGDPKRGEKFRTDFVDGLELCRTQLPEMMHVADRTRTAIAEA